MRTDQLARAFLLGVSTREPSFREYISEILDKLFEKIKSTSGDFFSEEFLVPGLLNFIRDWVWTYLSYLSVDIRLNETQDANFDAQGQWLSQQIYSSLAMLALLALMIAFYKIKKPLNENGDVKSFPLRLAIIYFIAASFAIYAWDRAQVFGADVFQNQLHCSAVFAAYASAIATGIEGAVQNTIITASRFATEVPRDLLKKENMGFFAEAIGKRVVSNLIANWPPGMFWQIAFTLGSTQNCGAVPTSFLVAFVVLLLNFICPKFSVFILSRWIKNEAEKIAIMRQKQQQNEENNNASEINSENPSDGGVEERTPDQDPPNPTNPTFAFTGEQILEFKALDISDEPLETKKSRPNPKLSVSDLLSEEYTGQAGSGCHLLAHYTSLAGMADEAWNSKAFEAETSTLKIDPSAPSFSESPPQNPTAKKPDSSGIKKFQLLGRKVLAANRKPEEKNSSTEERTSLPPSASI